MPSGSQTTSLNQIKDLQHAGDGHLLEQNDITLGGENPSLDA